MCAKNNCDHTSIKYDKTDDCCTDAENFACYGQTGCCTENLEFGFKVVNNGVHSCITIFFNHKVFSSVGLGKVIATEMMSVKMVWFVKKINAT